MADPVQTLRDKACYEWRRNNRGRLIISLTDALAYGDARAAAGRAEALEDPDATLIEAVARAIHEGQGHDAALWLQRPSWHREGYRRDALAAINAAAAVLDGKGNR